MVELTYNQKYTPAFSCGVYYNCQDLYDETDKFSSDKPFSSNTVIKPTQTYPPYDWNVDKSEDEGPHHNYDHPNGHLPSHSGLYPATEWNPRESASTSEIGPSASTATPSGTHVASY